MRENRKPLVPIGEDGGQGATIKHAYYNIFAAIFPSFPEALGTALLFKKEVR